MDGSMYLDRKALSCSTSHMVANLVADETKKGVVAKRKMPKWIQMIVDDFNFKSFGESFTSPSLVPPPLVSPFDCKCDVQL